MSFEPWLTKWSSATSSTPVPLWNQHSLMKKLEHSLSSLILALRLRICQTLMLMGYSVHCVPIQGRDAQSFLMFWTLCYFTKLMEEMFQRCEWEVQFTLLPFWSTWEVRKYKMTLKLCLLACAFPSELICDHLGLTVSWDKAMNFLIAVKPKNKRRFQSLHP